MGLVRQRKLFLTFLLHVWAYVVATLITFHGRLATKAPLTLGHESIGVVEEIGEGVLNLKTGDRIAGF